MTGVYIILEGIVRTGKTTQSTKLYDYLKNKFPEREVVLTREPGGTEIAESIRNTVQAKKFEEEMKPIAEAYLFAAARAQSLRKVVWPVLDNDGIVISDRSFISSLAYQGYAHGLGIKKVLEINKIAIEKYMPNMVLFLDLDPAIGLKRKLDLDGDKFEHEGVEFFKKIKRGYNKISEMPEFEGKWKNIDASGTEKEVFNRILKNIKTLFLS